MAAHLPTDHHALEANAACAGLALACAYSSSDEYEAEVIAVRRRAGAYGSQHGPAIPAILAFGLLAALLVVVLLAV
jgi:hypothetical protein